MRTSTFGLLLGLMLASCAHAPATDLTVDEHRHEVLVHEERAQAERAQFDPSAALRPEARGELGPSGLPGLGWYNPTEEHLRAADRELQAANDHAVAANSLLAFEHQACKAMSAAERTSCPLFASKVSLIELVTKGFILTFQTQVDVGAMYQRLNCHLAFAEATGFDRPSCPLFMKGTSIERVNSRSIAFTGDSEEAAAALHNQARRLFLGLVAARQPDEGAPAATPADGQASCSPDGFIGATLAGVSRIGLE
jgi:hypothetical protein